MDKKDNQNQNISLISVLISLFLASVSMFVFQVLLTRVFSPMLRYHYVFMLTSMAIFGLGIGGMIAYRLSKNNTQRQLLNQLPGWLILLSASYIGVFSLIFKLPFLNLFVVYSLLAAIPYIIGGIFISIVFKIMSGDSHRLYFADLFGSGVGSLAVVIFINQLGVVNTVLLVSGFAIISSLVLAVTLKNGKQIFLFVVFAVILGLIGTYQQGVEQFESRFKGYYTSPMTSLARIRLVNSEHKLEDWTWDAYARTDVIDTPNDDKSKIVTIDGGARSQMLQFDGDLSKIEYLKGDLNYLPFDMGKNDRVLLIGPGGGKDVVLALLAGSKDIDAVEISGGSVEIVRKYAEYNGNIYGRDEVNVFVQDGRNFVKQSKEQYDMIYLAQVMTGVAETVGYALAENFIYTKDAIKDYWAVLKDDGRISFILHDAKDLGRMTLTMVEALEELGVAKNQIANHIVVVNQQGNVHGGHGDNIHVPLMVVKKLPYTKPEIEQLYGIINNRMHVPLHLPYIMEDGSLKGFSEGVLTTKDFYFQGNTNLAPTTDNRPFFFDFNRGVDIALISLLAVVLLSLLFFKPVFKKNNMKSSPYYFIGLGVGFMLIEIPLIQMFSLLLGHPTRSFIVTLIALLIGAGTGSLVGDWSKFQWKGRYLPLLMIPFLTAAVYFVLNGLMHKWIISSIDIRILITFGLLFPLGFFMGMPFPHGIKILKKAQKESGIPLAWGVNGVTSVGGSVLAVIIAMKLGFSYTLAAGAFVYLLLFLLMPLYEKERRLV